MNNSYKSLSEKEISVIKVATKKANNIIPIPIDDRVNMPLAIRDIDTIDEVEKWVIENEKLIKNLAFAINNFTFIKRNIGISLSELFNLYLKMIFRTYNGNIDNVAKDIIYISLNVINMVGTAIDVSNDDYIGFCESVLGFANSEIITEYDFNIIYQALMAVYLRRKKIKALKSDKEFLRGILFKLNDNEQLSSIEMQYVVLSLMDSIYTSVSPFEGFSNINNYFNILLKLIYITYPHQSSISEDVKSKFNSIVNLYGKNIFVYSENMYIYNDYRNLLSNVNTVDSIKDIVY